MTYMFVEVIKPVNLHSKIRGKFLPIKDWVKMKNKESSDPIYSHPILLSKIYNGGNSIRVYCRDGLEFNETMKQFMEKYHG